MITYVGRIFEWKDIFFIESFVFFFNILLDDSNDWWLITETLLYYADSSFIDENWLKFSSFLMFLLYNSSIRVVA